MTGLYDKACVTHSQCCLGKDYLAIYITANWKTYRVLSETPKKFVRFQMLKQNFSAERQNIL